MIQKQIVIVLLILSLVLHAVAPAIVLADDVPPTDTPTETQVQDTPPPPQDTPSQPDENVTPPSDETPTPVPDENVTPAIQSDITPTEAPTPTPDVDITNTATVDNTSSNSAVTGENTTTNGGSGDGQGGQSGNNSQSSGSTTTTGDAVSVTQVNNQVNTTIQDSSIIFQVINIYAPQDGNIDISAPFAIANDIVKNQNESPVVNVQLTDSKNFAYITNTITSEANSGDNSITGGKNNVISTGNAFNVVTLFNSANFTILNSKLHIITINIFAPVNGNIILPNFVSTDPNCTACGTSVSTDNTATVTNNVNAGANTGGNIASASGQITTGDATTAVNILNIINTTIFGEYFKQLYVFAPGYWDGSFVGWDEFGKSDPATWLSLLSSMPTTGTGDCQCQSDLNATNNAEVTNTVDANANTGNNSVTGKNGSISTGNAFTSVSLINFINSNIINSVGFFGFINIFGNFHGNIGGKAELAGIGGQQPVDPPAAETKDATPPDEGDGDEAPNGEGEFDITQTNNVGDYVNPGDTVTFFVNVKNTGDGKIHGAKLKLALIRAGKVVGGGAFDLGDIDANKGLKLTTGLVLSKKIKGGTYTALAYITGKTGPDDHEVSGSSESSFLVKGNSIFEELSDAGNIVKPEAVLGAQVTTPKVQIKHIANIAATNNTMQALLLLVLMLGLYAFLEGIKKGKIFTLLTEKKS